MSPSFLAPHLDYVIFVHSLSLLFLGAYALHLFKDKRYLPWLWLGLFAITLALANGLLLINRNVSDQQLLLSIYWSLMALAFFFLANFGLHTFTTGWSRHWGYLITGLLLVLPAASAVLMGYQGFIVAVQGGLGLIASVFALAGVFKQGRARQSHGLVALFYPMLGVYTAALTLFPAGYLLYRGLTGGWESCTAFNLPAPFALFLTAVAAATAAAMAHSAVFKESETKEKKGLYAYIIGLSALGFAVFIGFTITDTLGDRVEKTLRDELFMRVAAVGNALDPDLVAQLQGDPDDPKQPYYRQLLEQLTKIRLANPDLRFVYLTNLRLKDRVVLITLDTEPPTSKDYAKPGEEYSEAPQELKGVFSTGRAALVGPYRDRWGFWISGFAPVKNQVGAILGVVGMDVSAKMLQSAVAANRLVGIVITFLLALIGAGLGMIIQRNKDLAAYNLQLKNEISIRKTAQKELAESEEKYRNLVERANDGIAIVKNQKLKYVNPRLAEMLDRDPSDLLGRNWVEIAAPEQRKQLSELYQRRMRGEDIPGGHETILLGRGGQPVAAEIRASLTPYKSQPAVLIIVRDNTERKKAEERLRQSERRYKELSIRDDLTSLYNSRHFHRQIAAEMKRSDRYQTQLSLILLDLDDFKKFNDSYGHMEGDRVLAELGRLILTCTRETDSAFRYGGEEFALILPETGGKEALNLAERLRVNIAAHSFALTGGKQEGVTASLGLAVHRPHEDPASFLRRADHNMYLAKQEGKNRTLAS